VTLKGSPPIANPKYSAVIPVFNSAAIVGETIRRTAAFFEACGFAYEIILINDGSSDGSWDVLCQNAEQNPHLVAINLLKNYGQHNALFCGLQNSTGDFVITLDDDMQNPPEEIFHLIETIQQGYDVVFGRFREKQHAQYRRTGSRLIALVNRRIFNQPKDLVVTNFRIIRRDVVDRICSYNTGYPYITGLVLMFSNHRANVWVEHQKRPVGKSNYNPIRIATLVTRILFNYSAAPLRLVSLMGAVISIFSFVLGAYFVLREVLIGFEVPGWTTIVVLLSFFNGVNIIILSMLGEYVIRMVKQFNSTQSYYVKDIIKSDA
jgi:glycosyltransferase involved in cell wall biosynthesis